MSPSQTYLALDLELNQPSGEIIQVGIAIANFQQTQSQYLTKQWLIDPFESINPEITTLTGISCLDIKEKAVSREQMAAELAALIVEHKVFVNPITWGGGDCTELLEEFNKQGIVFPHFGRRWIDVKTFHVMLMLAQGKSHAGGLKSVMGKYGLPFAGMPHRADVDASNTLRLFFKLLERHAAMESIVQLAKKV